MKNTRSLQTIFQKPVSFNLPVHHYSVLYYSRTEVVYLQPKLAYACWLNGRGVLRAAGDKRPVQDWEFVQMCQ